MNQTDFKVTLEAIKNATSCVAIASCVCGLPIKNSGDRCPSFIHAGSNPNSCVIHYDYWYSFSDAQGGDVIDLLALHSYDGDGVRQLGFYRNIQEFRCLIMIILKNGMIILKIYAIKLSHGIEIYLMIIGNIFIIVELMIKLLIN